MKSNEERKRIGDADEEGGAYTDKNVKIFKSKFLKFWPSKESRKAWRLYVF